MTQTTPGVTTVASSMSKLMATTTTMCAKVALMICMVATGVKMAAVGTATHVETTTWLVLMRPVSRSSMSSKETMLPSRVSTLVVNAIVDTHTMEV